MSRSAQLVLSRNLPAAAGAALFAISLALYVAARSTWLDDWDSVDFARAVMHFDIRLQQPHPPGYPAYVFFARLLNLFTNDPVASLTLLSALCGAIGVLAFYALASDLGFGWAAVPLAVMPLYWLNSVMAMSDIPGLTFVIAAVWLFNRAAMANKEGRPWWGSHRFYLLTGCAVAGVGAGVRPQDAAVPLSVLAAYTVPVLLKRCGPQAWREIRLGAGAFVASCLVWAIPTALSLGPLGDAWKPFRQQLDTIRGLVGVPVVPGVPVKEAVPLRIAEFGSVFSGYFGGPREGGLPAFFGLSLALLLLAVLAGRTTARRLALTWLLPYGVIMLLVMWPEDPRKVLPAVPPMLLLLGAATTAPAGKWMSQACLAISAFLTVFFAVRAAPLVRTLNTVPPPPDQAVAYVISRFSPSDTLVLANNSLIHLYYHMPQFKILPWYYISDEEFFGELAAGGYRQVVVLDIDPYGDFSGFAEAERLDFTRDPLVLPKASRVPLVMYERAPE